MRELFVNSNENNKVLIHNARRPGDALAVPAYWPAMGNATAPAKGQVLDPPPSQQHSEGLGKLFGASSTASHTTQTEDAEVTKKKRCSLILKIIYLVLAVINIVKSVALIAVAITTAIAIKVFTDEQSGRRVAMIMIAITAAITLSIAIYSIVAVLTMKTQQLMIASVVLLILAIIQAVLIGIATQLNEEDEVNLNRALSDSFRLSRDDSPRHVRLWNNIQHDLNCCGVYGPEDYRNSNLPVFFSPDVAVSCCPGYDSDRSTLVQERERESCKAKKEHYDVGCRDSIIELYRDTANTVLGVTIGLIVFMILLSIVGFIISRKCKPDENPSPPPPPQKKSPPKPPKL